MSVFRVEKDKNYTVMANYHLRDNNLSLKAIGLLSKMLSLPEDWDYSLKGLTTICKDGLAAIRTALVELEKNGYIVRERQRSGHGYWADNLYTIYEMPQNVDNLDERGCDKRICENRIYEDRTCEDHIQISKDITNIKKEPKNEGTKNACLLTPRVREEAVENFVSFIVDKVGRPLSSIERRILVHWVELGINPDLVHLAVEDNLFRDDRFNLRYVQQTLDEWQKRGIDNVRDAKNFVLNSHVNNLSYMAGEIAEENYNEKIADRIITRNEAADLQGTRDYIIDLFHQRRFDSVIYMIESTYHKEILEYLPQEIVEYYEQHKNDN